MNLVKMRRVENRREKKKKNYFHHHLNSHLQHFYLGVSLKEENHSFPLRHKLKINSQLTNPFFLFSNFIEKKRKEKRKKKRN